MKIPKHVKDEIDEKISIIHKYPDLCFRLENIAHGERRRLADIHSYWIEHPEKREELMRATGITKEHELIKYSRESIQRIRVAWAYLRRQGFAGRILGSITPELLIQVAETIDLQNHGFRTDTKTLGFRDYTPPNPVKVPELVSAACDEINGSSQHCVEIAATAHLLIAGIQPFYDGNKRTARLVQDRILKDEGLPCAVIPYGERAVYLKFLEEALVGMREVRDSAEMSDERQRIRGESMQENFGLYIAGKVNSTLDEVLGDLNPFNIRSRKK